MPSYVITGASRGLGYSFITHLASIPGNTVIGLVRNKPATDERLAKDGVKNVHIFQADVTDIKALQAAAEATSKVTGGKLDVLIHNAALVSTVSGMSTLLDFTPEELEKDLLDSFKANTVSVTNTVSAFLPLIRKGDVKKVAVISTGMADLDLVNAGGIKVAGPYAATKAATNMLVAKYNAALGNSEGILFLCISPGLVDTSEGKQPTYSEAQMKNFQELLGSFAKSAPHFKGPITPQESVTQVLDVIDKATVETMGGAFVSHHGTKQWL